MAQTAGIQRYELILLADMARMHLDREDFAGAAAQFRLLADKARVHPSQGLTRSQAIAGLVAAMVGQGELVQAFTAAVEGRAVAQAVRHPPASWRHLRVAVREHRPVCGCLSPDRRY